MTFTAVTGLPSQSSPYGKLAGTHAVKVWVAPFCGLLLLLPAILAPRLEQLALQEKINGTVE